MKYFENENGELSYGKIAGLIGLVLATVALTVGILFAIGYATQHYNVWAQEMSGKASLAKATQARKILVEQAKAEKEAATYRAEAIGIVGQAAKDYPEYREQEYLGSFGEALRNGNIEQIIYIPTEAGLPITEAGSRLKAQE